jgi:hypothetical protein
LGIRRPLRSRRFFPRTANFAEEKSEVNEKTTKKGRWCAAPHPALLRCVRLSLRTRELHCYDYADSTNPPVMHRKQTFLHPEHPLYAKFARLTRQEEQHGLLTDRADIGTRDGWQTRLGEAGFTLRGHGLVRNTGLSGH